MNRATQKTEKIVELAKTNAGLVIFVLTDNSRKVDVAIQHIK